jgi:hypothetical protein
MANNPIIISARFRGHIQNIRPRVGQIWIAKDGEPLRLDEVNKSLATGKFVGKSGCPSEVFMIKDLIGATCLEA